MKTTEYLHKLDAFGNERLRARFTTSRGRVMDIVVQYESFYRERWLPIVRYDCAHGFFHRDTLLLGGGKEKQSIAMERLEDALLYANQDIKDHWRWYKKQYLRRMKNDKEGNGGA